MIERILILEGVYRDSVTLMSASQAASGLEGVESATAVAATRLNLALLEKNGFPRPRPAPRRRPTWSSPSGHETPGPRKQPWRRSRRRCAAASRRRRARGSTAPPRSLAAAARRRRRREPGRDLGSGRRRRIRVRDRPGGRTQRLLLLQWLRHRNRGRAEASRTRARAAADGAGLRHRDHRRHRHRLRERGRAWPGRDRRGVRHRSPADLMPAGHRRCRDLRVDRGRRQGPQPRGRRSDVRSRHLR